MLRTGWTEAELGAARRATQDGLRWALYAETLTDAATVDLDHVQDQIDEAFFVLSKPSESAKDAHHRTRLGRLRAELAKTRSHKAEVRALLYPEDEVTDDG